MKNSLKRQSSLSKLMALSWPQVILVGEAFCTLAVFKGLLLVVPFSFFLKKANRSIAAQVAPDDHTLQTTVWAIGVVSNRIPMGFTCLVQALSAKWLLKKYADIRVHIGVHKNDTQEFSAHAWVAYKDTIIVGEQPTQVFQPILEWN